MSPIEKLLAILPSAKPSGSGWSARCPAHDDHSPSLSVSEGDDGRALLKCHAGCTTESVVAALGLKMSDLMQTNSIDTPRTKAPANMRFQTPEQAIASLEQNLGKHAKAWEYFDDQGELVGMVMRWNDQRQGKTFRPVSRQGNFWVIGAGSDRRPLYSLATLEVANLVFVVEGEKAADAAHSIGLTATTSAGGSNAPQKTDWSPLAGKKVAILPDNDEPGRKYAESVAKLLRQLTPPAVSYEIHLPGLPDKGDIVEWIAQTQKLDPNASLKDEILKMVNEAESQEAGSNEIASDDYQPFPVDALPEPLQTFVTEGSKAVGCDLSYFALPLLTALGSCIGNTRRIEVKKGWYAPPILWTCIVGESGTAKTPAFQLVMKPLRALQSKEFERYAALQKAYLDDLAKYDRDLTVWKRKSSDAPPPQPPTAPEPVRYFVQDTTVEALAPILMANPRGVLVARDELAGWFGSFDRYNKNGTSGSDASNWLSMYNAESITVDRKTGYPRTIHVKEAAVAITGGIQPAILQRAISGQHRESGMAARILLASPPRLPKRWREETISENIERQVQQIFERLVALPMGTDEIEKPVPILVKMHPDAKKIWVEFYDAHAIEQTELVGDMAASWSKLEEVVPRIALILHCVQNAADDDGPPRDQTSVSVETMQAAIKITQWFKNEIRRVFAFLDEDDEAKDRRKLIEWIRRQPEPVTARTVRQYCRWLKEPGEAEKALVKLVDKGFGTWLPSPEGQKGAQTQYFKLKMTDDEYGKNNKPSDIRKSVDVDNADKTTDQKHSGLLPN